MSCILEKKEKYSHVMKKLISVDQFGVPSWRSDIETRAGNDERTPIRYLLAAGSFSHTEGRKPNTGRTIGQTYFPTPDYIGFATSDLIPNEFDTFNEIAGLAGILRTIDMFPITLSQPRNILLVGAYTHKSLTTLLDFCESKRWKDSHVTLVDRSPIP